VSAVVGRRHSTVLRFAAELASPVAAEHPLSPAAGPAAGATLPLPADSGAADPLRTVGWVAAGVGGSALLLGAVAGIVAWTKVGEFDCSSTPCTSSDRGAVDSYNAFVTASTVGLVAGGVIAAAGGLLLLRHQLWGSDVTVTAGARAVSLGGHF
jgi:hypothetical protein